MNNLMYNTIKDKLKYYNKPINFGKGETNYLYYKKLEDNLCTAFERTIDLDRKEKESWELSLAIDNEWKISYDDWSVCKKKKLENVSNQ